MQPPIKLHIVGSGSPKPSTRRANSSYLIEVGDDRILLDHGFGSGQRLLELGLRPQDVSHVFLTHHHYDHIGDLPRLVLTRWDQQRTTSERELQVFGPPPLAAIMDRLFGPDGAFATDLRARIESACSRDLYGVRGGEGTRSWPQPAVAELLPGARVERPGWSVTCARAVHCPEVLACLAYRLDTPSGSIVYTGDTGPVESVAALARGCDILIHMCSQMSGAIATPAIAESCVGHLDVARTAAEAGVRTLVLTHIENLDVPATRERALREIRAVYDGELVVAEDLMSFELAPGKAGARTVPAARA